jgi:hypothetical protein
LLEKIKMGIEPFACSAIQTWNESCILGGVVGDSKNLLNSALPSLNLNDTS